MTHGVAWNELGRSEERPPTRCRLYQIITNGCSGSDVIIIFKSRWVTLRISYWCRCHRTRQKQSVRVCRYEYRLTVRSSGNAWLMFDCEEKKEKYFCDEYPYRICILQMCESSIDQRVAKVPQSLRYRKRSARCTVVYWVCTNESTMNSRLRGFSVAGSHKVWVLPGPLIPQTVIFITPRVWCNPSGGLRSFLAAKGLRLPPGELAARLA